ncbi:P-loop NTPase [Devriesea agamarum]|uniref:P-loop NTPase n=1 Tax=Devriesea agamarum TaxID=472569 RepID=UPI00071D8861|nr:P-loop NTPase [Devriesea agamarum]
MTASAPAPSEADLRAALATVHDPEIHRPITDLDMVESIQVEGTHVRVRILLTIPGCPMSERIRADVERALTAVPEVGTVDVDLGAMTPEQRQALTERLRSAGGTRDIPFNRPTSLTRVLAIGSGKGGVGKSSVTANLAAAMAASGLRVGVLDADIHGFSIPAMLGITQQPTKVDDLLMPPTGHGVKVMSIGMFVPPGQAVVWRGPKLHRAIEQFATDVFWGDLDVLLLDLPPGTGDVAISVTQLLPGAELVVVTTPQPTASDVAERVGSLAAGVDQKVAGVVENMSWLDAPGGERIEVFGSGGGQRVAQSLSARLGYEVPVLGQIPLEPQLRAGADAGIPVVIGTPECAAARALRQVADTLAHMPRGLGGRKLNLNVQ